MQNLQGNPYDYPNPLSPISPSTSPQNVPANKQWEDGVSTLEQSHLALVAFTPLVNFPMLSPPSDNSSNTFSVVVSTNRGDAAITFLLSAELQMGEIANKVAENWSKSLEIMADQVRQMINSPIYQEWLQIHLHGDPQQAQSQAVQGVSTTGIPAGVIASGVVSTGMASPGSVTAGVATSGSVAPGSVTPNVGIGGIEPGNAQGTLIAYLDRLQNFERISPPATVSESQNASESAKALIIPFTAVLVAGGALALGAFEMSTSVNGMSSNPLNSVHEISSYLQPLYPQLMQDVLPTINLLAMPLVYYTSWDASVGSLRNKERKADMSAAEDFANQVITKIKELPTNEGMSPDQRQQQAIIKLVLSSVALSLLYSVQVGKTMDGKFWGMEPKEFQGMLTGEIPIPDPSKNQDVSRVDQLKYTLLTLIKGQLEDLPADKKMSTLTALFSYLANPRSIEDMKVPGKVFSDVFASSSFASDKEDLQV